MVIMSIFILRRVVGNVVYSQFTCSLLEIVVWLPQKHMLRKLSFQRSWEVDGSSWVKHFLWRLHTYTVVCQWQNYIFCIIKKLFYYILYPCSPLSVNMCVSSYFFLSYRNYPTVCHHLRNVAMVIALFNWLGVWRMRLWHTWLSQAFWFYFE